MILVVLRRLLSGLLPVLLLCGFASVLAQPVLPVPTLTAHVMDATNTLPPAELQALDAKLAAFEASTGAQVVVLLVDSTLPEDIASFANRVANTWKIGRREVGDGLLLVVAKSDRRIRIEVAKSLEGAIPDLLAKRVIDQAITPRFKSGDFTGGIQAGVEQIMALIRGEALPAPRSGAATSSATESFQWMDLLVFLFFAVSVGGSIARRALGTNAGSVVTAGVVGVMVMLFTATVWIALLAALIALVFTLLASAGGGPRSGRGGWGGGTGSSWGGTGAGGGIGGGFRSGGGGDFGGGGASGRW